MVDSSDAGTYNSTRRCCFRKDERAGTEAGNGILREAVPVVLCMYYAERTVGCGRWARCQMHGCWLPHEAGRATRRTG